MLKKILTIATVSGLLLTASCGNESSQTKTTTQTSQPENKIVVEAKTAIFGTYEGTVMGANSEMKQKLMLNEDHTYVLETVYTGKSDKVYSDKGRFSVENENVVLDIKGGPSKYRIGNNYILQLDMDGKEITGNGAERFRFMKK